MTFHECVYRRVIRDPGSESQRIACGLAEQVLGRSHGECLIEKTVCDSCGRSFEPTAAKLNPVVASVVWNAASHLLAKSECDREASWGELYQAQRYVTPALAEESAASLPSPIRQAHQIKRRKAVVRPTRMARTRGGRKPRIGVVGYNTATGLGYLTRDLAKQNVVDSWLVVTHPRFPSLSLPKTQCRVEMAPRVPSESFLCEWLSGLDWVLFAELRHFLALPQLARRMGVGVALIPMWEFMSPALDWLRLVDRLICPTYQAFQMSSEWKTRFGFEWEVDYLAWPIEVTRFRFRRRNRCERFIFINGTGGSRARKPDGSHSPLRRKGLDLVLNAAKLAPEIPWIVYSQSRAMERWPPHVIVKPPPRDNAMLYEEGDVCVQPSRWEGVGLQLLECQAAGLPLITVDSAPMNEYQPLVALRSDRWCWEFLDPSQPIRVPMPEPRDLAQVLRELHGRDLGTASQAAREFVERHHNWEHTASAFRRMWER